MRQVALHDYSMPAVRPQSGTSSKSGRPHMEEPHNME